MTSAHPLRRLLARVCSTDTMARVVDPTLADILLARLPSSVFRLPSFTKSQ